MYFSSQNCWPIDIQKNKILKWKILFYHGLHFKFDTSHMFFSYKGFHSWTFQIQHIYLICLFILGCAGSSLVISEQGCSLLSCLGFLLGWLLTAAEKRLQDTESAVVVRAQLLCSMWDFSSPGIKLVSPALAGEFLTTGSPGNLPATAYLHKGIGDRICSRYK